MTFSIILHILMKVLDLYFVWVLAYPLKKTEDPRKSRYSGVSNNSTARIIVPESKNMPNLIIVPDPIIVPDSKYPITSNKIVIFIV